MTIQIRNIDFISILQLYHIRLIKTAAMMIMKFFLFSSLAHFYLIMSSSVIPQYGDIEQKQYNDFELVNAFHKYLTIPTEETHVSFRYYVKKYYKQSPIDCLNLLDRFRSNRVFKVIFWQALAGSYEFIDPTTITPRYYYNELEWISRKIRFTLFNCSCSDETIFKTGLETISLMVNSAERTASELKFLGNNDKLIRGFDDLIATCKYLMRNTSIDFTIKTINYYSLLRTFNEISILIKTNSSSNGPSLRHRYSLLWFYMHHIYNNNCNVIFDTHHHHKTLIIYLIIKIGNGFWSCGYGINGLYPNMLGFLFEKLYENESQQLESILELFGGYKYNIEYDHNWVRDINENCELL